MEKRTPMEITPMANTSYQIHCLSKGCLGITYCFISTKTVATGGKKPVAVDGPLNKSANISLKYTNNSKHDNYQYKLVLREMIYIFLILH